MIAYITECTSVMSAFYGHNFGWCMTVVHASCQSYCMLISDPTRRASLQTIECIITVHVLTFEAYCTSLCTCMYTLLILTALIGYTCAGLHCYERFQSNDWHHRSRSDKRKLNSCCWASRLSPCIIRTWFGSVFSQTPNSIAVRWNLYTWWWMIASEQHTVFCCTNASSDELVISMSA